MGGPGSGRKKGSKNKGSMPGILKGHAPNKMPAALGRSIGARVRLYKEGSIKKAKIAAKKAKQRANEAIGNGDIRESKVA